MLEIMRTTSLAVTHLLKSHLGSPKRSAFWPCSRNQPAKRLDESQHHYTMHQLRDEDSTGATLMLSTAGISRVSISICPLVQVRPIDTGK